MSILIFFCVLFVLILVHEWGHFIVAKKTGMRVDEFGIGFPPKIFGIKRGETEYTLNVLPIGGFVRIFGENALEAVGNTSGSAFTDKSKWAQALVLVAGVTMNILLAWLLFSITLTIGAQTAVTEETATEAAQLMITDVAKDGPAERAGIERGSIIHSVSNGDETILRPTPTEFRNFVANNQGNELLISHTYQNEQLQTLVAPTPGLVPNEPNRVAVGVALTQVESVSRPFHSAVYESFFMTITSLRDITLGIGNLLWDTVRFKADFSQVAGPIGIVGLVDEASAFGITALLTFTAFISLNLAVINLLPFPALDGGRLLFVIIEAVKGSPLKASWVHGLNTAGFVFLILLMVAVTFSDISKII